MPSVDLAKAWQLARSIAEMPPDDVVAMVRNLTTSKRLSATVHALNHLLGAPEHRDLAKRALERMGFAPV